jgi:hypothetical protein
LTNPSSPVVRFGVGGLGGIEGINSVVCVSADSPEGNYTFTTTNVTVPTNGSTVGGSNPAVVARGTCFPLISRLIPEDEGNRAADPASSVTFSYTSSSVPGATRTGTICHNDPGIPASDPCGATVTSYVNILAGSETIFSFTSPGQMIDALRVTLSNLDVPKPIKHELDDRLRDASKSAAKGHNNHTCDQLDQFIKKLNEQSKKKKIQSADAANLLAEAEEIQVTLGC